MEKNITNKPCSILHPTSNQMVINTGVRHCHYLHWTYDSPESMEASHILPHPRQVDPYSVHHWSCQTPAQAPLRALHTLTPKCVAVLSRPGSALNFLQSSFKSMFPGPHPGEPGRSGWDWKAGLQMVLVLSRLRKAWPLGEPRLPV